MAQGIQIGKVAEHTGLSIDTIRFYQMFLFTTQDPRYSWVAVLGIRGRQRA